MTITNYSPFPYPVIQKLMESKFHFNLTGSRFFQKADPGDWDFFVQDQEGIREFLTEISFNRLSSIDLAMLAIYKDSNTAEVWGYERPNPYRDYDEQPEYLVHVQIVLNAALKNMIQTELFSMRYWWNGLDKPTQRSFWHLFYRLLAHKEDK